MFAERLQIDDGAQGPADQTLDFLGAAGRVADSGFAPHALGGGARQHAIFGRDPTAPLAFQPRRQALLDRCGAQDMGIAEFD